MLRQVPGPPWEMRSPSRLPAPLATVEQRPMASPRAGFGFSVHTGWATLVAITGGFEVVDRRRIDMVDGTDRQRPRFAHHAARALKPAEAPRLIRAVEALAFEEAEAALRAAVDVVEPEVVACGIVVSSRPLTATLDVILDNHSLVHAAEGELFRRAIRRASDALGLEVTEVGARELHARAADVLGGDVDRHLARIGKTVGRPWSKDHREACLAAAIALTARF
ncbi:MAG TPA: hypothetical protein VL049_00630 [Candidatus Dormibacteraeota bacterium]|nr:hypothetical protein [Candidatus Dormibacteraeota bacterium]